MKTLLTLVLVAVISIGTQAFGRSNGVRGVGPRLGFSSSPDQFRFGGQLDLGDVAPSLMLQPSLEVGVGDNVTTTSLTLDLNYRFHSSYNSWSPYLGMGAGPIFYSERYGRDNTDLGVYLQGGLVTPSANFGSDRFFMEMRAGLASSPDFVLSIGWLFGQ